MGKFCPYWNWFSVSFHTALDRFHVYCPWQRHLDFEWHKNFVGNTSLVIRSAFHGCLITKGERKTNQWFSSPTKTS